MQQFKSKIELIFLPFLYIAFSVIGGCTFLNWLLFIKFHAFKIDDEIINLWVPMILPGIPVLIWLRPRIKLLKLNNSGRRDPLAGYIMLAWATISISTAISQNYIVTATGKLTVLDNIARINELPATKYYTVKEFYVNPRFLHAKTLFTTSGKNNEYFDMRIYVSLPVFAYLFPDTNQIAAIRLHADPRTLVIINGTLSNMERLKRLYADSIIMMRYVNPSFVMNKYGDAGKYGAILVVTRAYKMKIQQPVAKIEPVAWFGIKYYKSISNNLTIAEKQQAYKEFTKKCDADLRFKRLNGFEYLDRPVQKDLINYVAAIKAKDDVIGGEPIVLLPVYENFADRNGNKLAWIFGSTGIGSAVFILCLSIAKLRHDALEDDVKIQIRKDHRSALLWTKGLFVPKKGHLGTQILIELNLLIFIVMVCSGFGFISLNVDSLLKWGANYRPLIMHGEYWRLLTNTFLHGGLLHVLFNMYGLFFVGIFLEPVMGTTKYTLAYLFTGIIASAASVWWHSATVSVGASGAIFGLYGIFFAYLTVNIFPPEIKKPFLINTAIFIGYNLLYGLTGGIDNAAHVGGLISGLFIGYATCIYMRNKMNENHGEAKTQHILDELQNKPHEPMNE